MVSLEGGELGGRGESEAADQQVVHHVEVRPKLLEDGGVAGEEGQHRTAQVALQVPQHTLTLEGGGGREEGGGGGRGSILFQHNVSYIHGHKRPHSRASFAEIQILCFWPKTMDYSKAFLSVLLSRS